MIRVFCQLADRAAGKMQIFDDEAHYLLRVRRVAVGEQIQLFDGEGRSALANVVAVSGGQSVTVETQAVTFVPPAHPQITACIPLIKGDRFDFCLEKLVEVGVDHIVIWQAERAVVQLDASKAATKLVRWQESLKAAARQAGCAHTPTIAGVKTLEQLQSIVETGQRQSWPVLMDPQATSHLTTEVAKRAAAGAPANLAQIHIVTGPEGGMSPHELDVLTAAGALPCRISARVLRAETAPVVAVAVLRGLYEQGQF
jgi:16S rRNA (uracil1498-N3)-methyltransferase